MEKDGPATVESGQSGIIDSFISGDGNGVEYLRMARPGMGGEKEFMTHEDVEKKTYHPQMDGRHVFKNAVLRMEEAIQTLLDRNQLQAKDIDLLVPHQANKRINDAIQEKLGLKDSQVVNTIQFYGNTTAATIPLGLKYAEGQGRLKKGDLIMTVAFGAGFSWGANLIRW